MPSDNITRVEAQQRKTLLEVDGYDVRLDLTTGAETFRSTTTVRFTASAAAPTFIDAILERVHAITLNGAPVDPDAADGVRIRLDVAEGVNELTVDADFAYTNTGEGLHRFVDPVDGEVYLYTQFEVPDSRRVYAVFEQPDLKASFRFTVTAPAHWQVVSNQPTPEPIAAASGAPDAATWAFEPTPRISSYVTALVAGPYAVVRDELTSADGRSIPLGVFARRSLSAHLDADYIFATTKQGFAYYEQKFGYPYPFDKYDQLFVPEFNAGAMENAGAVTFTETYVFRSKVTDAVKERRVVTILHELAHMWFGDLVTMKWWNDLWLNESFAEWASTIATAEATEWTEAWTTFQAMEKSWAYRQDQLPSTHPIVAEIRDLEDVQVNFDGITYAKGGSVLKQLAAWVGIDAFFAGVGAYFRKHHHGNTELADLLVELEATSGRDLGDWSALWLETAGVNTLRPEFELADDGSFASFAVLQSATAEQPTIRPHRMTIGLYELVDGALERQHRLEIDVDGERTEVAALRGIRRPALVLLNDDDLAYAKVRLDADSLAVAIRHLADIASPLARAVVWGAAWDMTRDGEMRARDYVRLVLGNIARESESTTLRLALTQLVQAARSYVDPAIRAETVERVGTELWALARLAEPGSDAQFQFVKFFANAASTPAHGATLAGLLEGSVVLEGLTIDTDLGWELLEGMVLVRAAGEAEIARMLERDNTSNGQQAAARARATIPTAEGKAAALEAVLGAVPDGSAPGGSVPDIPNVIVRQMGIGFQHVNDPAPLAPLVPRFLDALVDVWRQRSYAIAGYIVGGFYPAPLASPELVEATRAWLASAPDIPALSRLVTESLAGVERAVMVQQRDRQGESGAES
ncbi:MAG: aminopeptidase N [Microbacteriaceae bacterium]